MCFMKAISLVVDWVEGWNFDNRLFYLFILRRLRSVHERWIVEWSQQITGHNSSRQWTRRIDIISISGRKIRVICWQIADGLHITIQFSWHSRLLVYMVRVSFKMQTKQRNYILGKNSRNKGLKLQPPLRLKLWAFWHRVSSVNATSADRPKYFIGDISLLAATDAALRTVCIEIIEIKFQKWCLVLFLKTVIWYKNTTNTTDTPRMQSAKYYTGGVVTL